MTRLIIPLLILLALAGTAHAIGIGQLGARFGGLGSIGKSKPAGPPPTCADDGPDGTFDLSKCSNAIYLAGIL